MIRVSFGIIDGSFLYTVAILINYEGKAKYLFTISKGNLEMAFSQIVVYFTRISPNEKKDMLKESSSFNS